MRLRAGRRATGKGFAAIAILFLIAAQFLAVAHFHRSYSDPSFNQHKAVAAADVCGLCDLGLHAPMTPAAPLAINHPLHKGISVQLPGSRFTPPGGHIHFLTRAPPSAVA